MNKEWEKRELYEKYAGICLSEEEYKNLENQNIIPKSLNALYSGNFANQYSGFVSFSGIVIDNICSCGTKLFLESWSDLDTFTSDHTAVFFFDDFLVIFVEPRINLSDSFDRAPDVLPVAIPICNIKKYTTDEYVAWYRIIIEFTNGEYYYAVTVPNGVNSRSQLRPRNFSFHINSRLLGGFSQSISDKKRNLDKITNRLDLLIQNCCKDYKSRIAAIKNLFSDLDIVAQLQKTVYLDKQGFVDEIMKKESLISATDFPDVVSGLNAIREVYDKNKGIVKTKNEEKKKLNSELSNKKTLLRGAPFLKKFQIKKAISDLEEKIQRIDEEIASLVVPEEKYDLVMAAILKAKSNNKAEKLDKSSYGIPKTLISKAKNVYLMCKERNVTKLETEDEKKVFTLICEDKKVPKKHQNVNLFNCGAQEAFEYEREKNYEKYQQSRTKRIVKFNEEKEKSNLIGRIKYIQNAIEDQKKAEDMAKATQLLGQLADIQTQTRAVKSDSAILGGIANAIAGPAMGIATYAKVEQENAMAEVNAAETRRQGRENLSNARSLEASYQAESSGLGWTVDKINAKLCDISDSYRYYSYLDCNVESYTVEFDGTMTINIKIEFVEEPKMNGIPIVIDGSLRVEIKSGDKKVGEAYVCAPGFDETHLDKVGFNAQKKYSVIGIPMLSDFVINQEYTFEFKPVNVWMIEK